MNCPYCSKEFNNWKSVRAHISGCVANDHSVVITLEYGPISYNEISNLTSRAFCAKYPLISSNKKHDFYRTMRKYGYGIKSFCDTSAKEAALAFFKAKGRNPTSRDTYKDYSLPTDNWCKERYGSWNDYLEFCGLERNNQAYGIRTKALDGCEYLSTLEAKFVDKFLFNRFDYIYEKSYPNKSGRFCDFYLPQLDLYIEVAGGFRPEVIQEKINFCIRDKLNLKVIYPKDLDKSPAELFNN